MRHWMAWLICLGVAGAGGSCFLLSGSWGQETPPHPTPGAERTGTRVTPKEIARPARDLTKLPPLRRQMELSAQCGANWLFRANRPDGRFIHGYLPAVQLVLEGDHYLRQVGAVVALARSARFIGDEDYLARARQALLTLLLDTAPDPQDARQRRTTLPSSLVNRLGAAGLLLVAIHELPSPGEDLLQQSDQLCAFIALRQAADGSLNGVDGAKEATPSPENPEATQQYPGMALYGLMRSQAHRPMPWKTDVVRKALKFYRAVWKTRPNMGFVPWHVAAFTEAHLLTKEQPFADFVFELSDWICELQYVQLDQRHPLWVGGFMGFADGKPVLAEPQVGSAVYAEALAHACRVARQTADVTRYQRFSAAARSCLQFVSTLQYTEGNTTHFTNRYKEVLLGGFHATPQDGTLRLDYTQQAVCALVQYLTSVTD